MIKAAYVTGRILAGLAAVLIVAILMVSGITLDNADRCEMPGLRRLGPGLPGAGRDVANSGCMLRRLRRRPRQRHVPEGLNTRLQRNVLTFEPEGRTLSTDDVSTVDREGGTLKDTSNPVAFLPLPSATLHILVALMDGEKHGYAIMGEVEALSDGAVRMGPGTLYGSIKRMLADGFIEELAERPDPELDDQRRRYYRLTGLGQQVCVAELRRLEALVRRAGSPEWARSAVPRLGQA